MGNIYKKINSFSGVYKGGFCKILPAATYSPAKAVPSALEGLTSVFGMGTGVSPPLSPPEIIDPQNCTKPYGQVLD